jgi:hypothetical protein
MAVLEFWEGCSSPGLYAYVIYVVHDIEKLKCIDSKLKSATSFLGYSQERKAWDEGVYIDNWGGGGFLLKAIVFTVCEHEYMNIHTLSHLGTALWAFPEC